MAKIQPAVLLVMFCVLLKESSWVSGSSEVDKDFGLNGLRVDIFRAKRSTSCQDVYSTLTCQSWRRIGLCSQYKHHCRRSCGLCNCRNINDKTSCNNWVINGQCTSSKYAKWMKTNCAMSCGQCHCKNNNKYCSDWAKKGECKKNPRYMLVNCQISCGVCRPIHTKYTTNTPITVKKTTSKSNDDVIKCGTKAVLGRIVGGSKAQPKSWPWQIGIKSCPNCTFFCGGTIVAKKWVITAAHCLVNQRASDLFIDAGVTDQGKITKYKQSFNCTAIYSHQSYAINAPFDQDIAILKLNKEVVFNDYVRPLCLNEKKLKASQLCSVTGFGRTKENGPKSMSLLKADVPIVAHDVCVKSYKKTKPPRPVTKNMVCAGYSTGGIDACAGDSGGPLTCWDQNKGRYVLGGIVSWGVGCARAKHYGVYTDVEHLTAWITSITGTIQ